MRHQLRRTIGVVAATAIGGFGAIASTAQAPLGALPTADIVRAGLKPIRPGPQRPASFNTLTVGSSSTQGVVSPEPTVYLVFWGSQWSTDPAGAAGALYGFFGGLHGPPDTYDRIFTQYCEGVPAGTAICGASGIHIEHPNASSLAGAWLDNASAAPKRATASQIAGEAVRAAEYFGNTRQGLNLNAQYVIASAHGTHPDGFPGTGFCAWHGFTPSVDGKLAFTNLPYVPDLGKGACTTLSPANLLDGYFSTVTHEYAETLTDFWPSRGWNGGNGEIGDECVNLDSRITLPTGVFDVQGEWSNKANKCVTTG
jgi:serine protease